jgi:hypothetical protein
MTVVPDPSLFGLQRRLLRWIVDAMDWSCERVSYVTNGRPIYIENSVHVWRARGPYPSMNARELVDLAVTCVTCTGTAPALFPDGTFQLPSPDEWEQAAVFHEGDVAAIYGLIKRHGGWLVGREGAIVGHTEADPDAETSGGCYGTTIRVTVPWTAGTKCDVVDPPDPDDGEVCC